MRPFNTRAFLIEVTTWACLTVHVLDCFTTIYKQGSLTRTTSRAVRGKSVNIYTTRCSIYNYVLCKVSSKFYSNTVDLNFQTCIQTNKQTNKQMFYRNRRQYLDIYNINTCKLNTLKLTIAVRNLQQYTNRVAWLEQRHAVRGKSVNIVLAHFICLGIIHCIIILSFFLFFTHKNMELN
jgi:hypothetical protein